MDKAKKKLAVAATMSAAERGREHALLAHGDKLIHGDCDVCLDFAEEMLSHSDLSIEEGLALLKKRYTDTPNKEYALLIGVHEALIERRRNRTPASPWDSTKEAAS